MLSLDSSTQKQPASRRLLHILRDRAKVPFAMSTAAAVLIAVAGAQLRERDTASASPNTASRVTARAYSRLGPRVPVRPDDVVKDGVVIGRDPDPFIRGEMLRHYGVGGP